MRAELLSRLLAAWLAMPLLVAAGNAAGNDTPELLAAMRAGLPPVPPDVPHRNALPAELRREIPPVTIGLHRWHADPSQRRLQIDGRSVPENGVAGRELWLREIRPDGIVLQFRDVLFFQPLR